MKGQIGVRTVVFDFDGTIAVGDGPVDAYGRHVAELARLDGFAEAVRAARVTWDNNPGVYRDGYDVVASVARAMGVPEAVISTAYLRSRNELASPSAPVFAVPGLADFLDRLAIRARLVLLTNAPPTRVDVALSQFGLGPVFDEYVFNACKPTGVRATVGGALAHRGPVLCVGDTDELDLAPARALGADTALVGPSAASVASRAAADRPTFAAATLDALFADIEGWAGAPLAAGLG